MRTLTAFAIFLIFFVRPLSIRFAGADEPIVRKMLPSTTAIYVEVKSLESVLEHPLSKTLQDSTAFKKLWRSPDLMKLRGGLVLFEFAIGDKVDSLAKNLTANGFHFAVDKTTEGAVLLACTESQEWIEEYLQKLVKLTRADANSKNQPDPIREIEYRGIRGYEFQKIIAGSIGSILLVTNKKELGKSIIDRHLDSTDDHLLSNSLFQRAWTSNAQHEPKNSEGSSEESIVKAFIDLDTLRDAGVAKDLLMGKSWDFAGELILGGVLASIQKTSFAAGELFLAENKLSMQLRIPHQREWTEKSRTFFVGPMGNGHASSLIDSSGWMASLSAYRNLTELWLRAGDLFNEKVNDQLAQADNTLTTLFSGKDFGTDILGAIEPQIQLLATEQQFEPSSAPAIQLPSFGLVAKLKNPMMKNELKRTFQSFIGFLNVTGAMQGNPQLDLDSESIDGKQIYTATYIREGDKQYENGLPIQFNFSPTLAFDGDLVFIASTNALVKKVAINSAKQNEAETLAKNNTVLEINFKSLQNGLEANRRQLVSQNMLEKGHSKSEAEKEIDTLINLLSLLRTGTAVLRFDDHVHLKFELDINSDR